MDKVVSGHRLDLMTSNVLSNLNNSMILQNLTALLFSLVWLSGYPDTLWIRDCLTVSEALGYNMGNALTGICLPNPITDILTFFSHMFDCDFQSDTLKVSSSCPPVKEYLCIHTHTHTHTQCQVCTLPKVFSSKFISDLLYATAL